MEHLYSDFLMEIFIKTRYLYTLIPYHDINTYYDISDAIFETNSPYNIYTKYTRTTKF